MEDKLKLKEEAMWLTRDLKNVLQEVYDHYRSVVSTCEYLRKENERLKNEQYKDEELSKMKENYNRMKREYYRGFPISEEEDKKIKEWEDKIIGDEPDMKINCARFYYEFHPTPIGVVGKVIDSLSGEKFEFQSIS